MPGNPFKFQTSTTAESQCYLLMNGWLIKQSMMMTTTVRVRMQFQLILIKFCSNMYEQF